MRMISYNLNGIRAAMRKGLVDWVSKQNLDVLCFQETKAQPEQVDLEPFRELGYEHARWHSAEKKGYSGVLTLSKKEIEREVIGLDIEKFDKEGRVLRTDFGEITVLNCYFPSGTTGDVRQQVKYEFLDTFFDFATELVTTRKNLIIVGDYNIAHTEIDIHNPKANKKTSGFLPEERAWMTKWFDAGFFDSFRVKHPDLKDDYSWWSYRSRARDRNKGWRIDYISVSKPLVDSIIKVEHRSDAVHSDHCPVLLEIDR